MYLTHTQQLDHNLMRLFIAAPDRYSPIVEFLDKVTHELSELSWIECELIGVALAKDNRSEFCLGIRKGVITALSRNSSMSTNARLDSVVTFARLVNRNAGAITRADLQKVRVDGWSDQTIEDVVGLVAILRLYSTLATGLGFKTLPNPAFKHIGLGTVDAGGYLASFNMYLEESRKQKP